MWNKIKHKFSKKTKQCEDLSPDISDLHVNKINITPITYKHLIVDDSKTNRYVLSKYLERVGINVDEAIDGIECLEYVKKHDINYYDAIWMDIRMPKMDGMEATQQLRQTLCYKKYIIGLTGHVEVESRKQCIKLGMNYIIAKPILRNELYSLLYELFQINSL